MDEVTLLNVITLTGTNSREVLCIQLTRETMAQAHKSTFHSFTVLGMLLWKSNVPITNYSKFKLTLNGAKECDYFNHFNKVKVEYFPKF